MKFIPAMVGMADTLKSFAQAKDLKATRAAVKPLRESLIQFVKDQKISPDVFYVVYCPMARGSWLQSGRTIINPYMGKAMGPCGEIKT
jgi:hypothetical protein